MDSNNDINDVNEATHHLKNNNKDSIQYVITAHLSNAFFMLLLIVFITFSSNQTTLSQNFFLNGYVESLFRCIMADTSVTKVSTTEKS